MIYGYTSSIWRWRTLCLTALELVESFGHLEIEQLLVICMPNICKEMSFLGAGVQSSACSKAAHGSLVGRGRCRRCRRLQVLTSPVLWMPKNVDAVHQSKTFRRWFCFVDELLHMKTLDGLFWVDVAFCLQMLVVSLQTYLWTKADRFCRIPRSHKSAFHFFSKAFQVILGLGQRCCAAKITSFRSILGLGAWRFVTPEGRSWWTPSALKALD